MNDRENITGLEQLLSFETKPERERRRNLGIYYTPPEAAKILARWTIRDPEERVLEPSFGGCAMLAAAVSVFRSLGNPSPSKQLFGYDIDSKAFEHLSQLGIDNYEGNFKKTNFLRGKPSELKVDAVLANPPFVSYHRQTESQRRLNESLRMKYFPALPKFASLWAFFVLHSMAFLRPGGRMAFVLPNAVATASYGRALLDFLSHRFQEVEVVHVGERLFIQAGADERIVLLLLSDFIPDGKNSASKIKVKHVLRVSEIDKEISTNQRHVNEPEIADVHASATSMLYRLAGPEQALSELHDVATVLIGEVVGNIPFFVQLLSVWQAKGIDKKYLAPLLTRAVQATGIYLKKDLIESGQSRIPYLLLPPEGKLPTPIQEYLAQYAFEDIENNKTFMKRAVWYRCSYNSAAHAFIGSMNHEWPKIISNAAGMSCSNSYYKITLNKRMELLEWLPLLSLTTPFRLSAEIYGRVRGSGGIKLEPSDVRRLYIPNRLPSITKQNLSVLCERIDKLVRDGELNAAGQLADSVVYLKPGLINAKTMYDLHRHRLALTARRLCKA